MMRKAKTIAEYLAGVRASPRRSERGDLRVRVFGDTAIMTGGMTNYMPKESGQGPIKALILQVWVKQDGAWRQIAFQATFDAPAPKD